jgi:hypothetical protein
MTLLRMLAFAPQGDSKVPPRAHEEGDSTSAPSGTGEPAQVAAVEPKPADAPISAGDNYSVARQVGAATPEQPVAEKKTSEIGSGVVAEPLPGPVKAEREADAKAELEQEVDKSDWPVTVTGDALLHWHELVHSLTLGGVARMIAEHSVPLSFALPNVALLLSKQHDMLLSDVQVINLGRGLSEVCDQAVNLTVEIGDVREETPAVYRARLAHERQISAEQALQADETVKSLLADFGGSIDEIKPA